MDKCWFSMATSSNATLAEEVWDCALERKISHTNAYQHMLGLLLIKMVIDWKRCKLELCLVHLPYATP